MSQGKRESQYREVADIQACWVRGQPRTLLRISVQSMGEQESGLQAPRPSYRHSSWIAVSNPEAPEAGRDLLLKMNCQLWRDFKAFLGDRPSRIRASEQRPDTERRVRGHGVGNRRLPTWLSSQVNENLNVLIGGRGGGEIHHRWKFSGTCSESSRSGDEARRMHHGCGCRRLVLGAGTKISLTIRSYTPDERLFTMDKSGIHRQVIDSVGNVLAVRPLDVIRGVTVWAEWAGRDCT